MSDILSQIEEIQSNVRDIKSTWGNTIMTIDNIKTGLKSDRQKAIEEAYQKGLDDAWEAARKLFSSMADSDIEKAFPIEWNNGGFKALMNLQPQEAIAKLQAYEEKKADDEIKVGNEVKNRITDDRAIVISTRATGSDKHMYLIFDDGSAGIHEKSEFFKTGRHFPEVVELLKKVKGGAE